GRITMGFTLEGILSFILYPYIAKGFGWQGQLVAHAPKKQKAYLTTSYIFRMENPICATRTDKICQCHSFFCNAPLFLQHLSTG
ncbi:MAG: hypothetical protein PF482_18845, partial [Desulfobacteraceae bacterium]|nr:hypothetical protein [Desulfobacteraceae bacterium]